MIKQPKAIPASDYMNIISRWKKQALKEQLDWFSSRNLSEKQIEAYSAGFEQAWGQLLGTLKLHGYIVQYHTTTHMVTGQKEIAVVE